MVGVGGGVPRGRRGEARRVKLRDLDRLSLLECTVTRPSVGRPVPVYGRWRYAKLEAARAPYWSVTCRYHGMRLSSASFLSGNPSVHNITDIPFRPPPGNFHQPPPFPQKKIKHTHPPPEAATGIKQTENNIRTRCSRQYTRSPRCGRCAKRRGRRGG